MKPARSGFFSALSAFPTRGQAAILALVAVTVYLPALHAGFIWDDRLLVTGNDLVRAADGWIRIWFGTESPDYFPVTYTSFWLEWQLWGANPAAFHALNLALHAINTLLLWRVLLRLRIPGAWLAALLFAVHPVNAASVAWVSERKNTLSMAFYLASALCYFRHEAGGRRREYVAALAFFLLALLSKTSVVALPPVLLLCAWWQRGRISWTDIGRTVPFFALSLAAGLGTIWFQNHNVINDSKIVFGDWPTQLARAGCAICFYGLQLLLPWNLSMVYPRWEVHAGALRWFLPGILLVAIGIAAAIFRRTWGRPVLFALGYFLLSLFPVLGFFKMYYFRFSPVADQWLYLPGIGILALAAAAGVVFFRRFQIRLAGQLAAAAIVVILGVLTWQRAVILQRPETLWADVLRRDPESWVASSNLALAALAQGRNAEALSHARMAASLEPDSAESYFNLGAILDANGLMEESIATYRTALRLAPGYAPAHNELALALERGGHPQEALREYGEAVRLQPGNFQFQLNLGALLYKEDRYDEAVGWFHKVLELRPDSVDGHNDLGAALHAGGHLREAAAEYREALRLDPSHADARRNLEAIRNSDPAAAAP